MTEGDVINSRCFGSVKWFNGKQGYGFLNCLSGERRGEDVFVHHSSLQTGEQVYRYLVQGEYVEFEWEEASGDHRWHAADVTGVQRGKLMCETRSDSRAEQGEGEDGRRRRGGSRARGGGPRDAEGDAEWTDVKSRSRQRRGADQSREVGQEN